MGQSYSYTVGLPHAERFEESTFEAIVAQKFVACLEAVQRPFCSSAGWRVLVMCVSAGMSEAHGCRLSKEEAITLWQSGSFWPDSLLDKDTFMELLGNVLSLEFHYQISEWEKQLIATRALGDAGQGGCAAALRGFVGFHYTVGRRHHPDA
eukprot:3917530-Amphidinium_carterae.1